MTDPDAERRTAVAAFDSAAQDFDTLTPHLWGPVGAGTVSVAAPQPGERILDACCGTGASALPTARLVGATGHVDAVDLSAPLIDILDVHAAELPQLQPHHADVTIWPGQDYDLVQSVLGIFFLPDMAEGTRRLFGRCRPGGRVAFTIWRQGAVVEAGQRMLTAVAATTGSAPPPARTPHLVEQLGTSTPYRRWLKNLGLLDVDVQEQPRTLLLTAEVAWLVISGSGFRAMLDALDTAQRAEAKSRYLEGLDRDRIDWLDTSTLVGLGRRPG